MNEVETTNQARITTATNENRVVHTAPAIQGTRPTTRDLLVAAAIGVAGSLIVVPLTYLQVIAGIAHVYLVAATLGLWFLPCVVPLIVVRKPGASLIACLTMGVVSAVTTPFGIAAIGALVLEGVLVELPFLVVLYRRWSRLQFIGSALCFSALMGTMTPRAVGVESATTAMTLNCFAIVFLSSLVFLVLGFVMAKKLRARGITQ